MGVVDRMEKSLAYLYLAGVFDTKGFINKNLKPDGKRRTKFNISFNFTDKQKELFEKIACMLDYLGIKCKIYETGRTKGKKKEYQLYITKREHARMFLSKIHNYSLRREEIMKALWELQRYELKKKR